MKKLKKYLQAVTILSVLLFAVACNKVVDLKPINEISDASFWTTPSQFQLAANEFYTYLRTFTDIINDNPHADRRGDFMWLGASNSFSNGSNAVPASDGNWNTSYARIRATNYL